MVTKIFSSYKDFYDREDKKVNGVSPNFAKIFPNFEGMNSTNIGCWNCIKCINCIDCDSVDFGFRLKKRHGRFDIYTLNNFEVCFEGCRYFTRRDYVFSSWIGCNIDIAEYHEREVRKYSGTFLDFYRSVRRNNPIKKSDVLFDFYVTGDYKNGYALYNKKHNIVCETTINIEDVVFIYHACDYDFDKMIDCIKNNTFNLI